MGEQKNILVKAAMTFGFAMGGYWIFKYLFFIWAFTYPTMNAVYWGLTGAVPFIAYTMTKRYRQLIGGTIGFFHAWQFGVLLYAFSALIVSLEHYVFYRYIAPSDLLTNVMNQTIEWMKQSKVSADMITSISSMHITPIQMTLQGIFTNVFYGVVFSIPVAMFVSYKRNNLSTPPRTPNENNE